MTALALSTVNTFNGNTVDAQRIISLDHVTRYQAQDSGNDTRVYYNPNGDLLPIQIILDDTYSSFDSVFQDKTGSVGIPMYFLEVDRLPVNEQRVLNTADIVWIQQRADGVSCDVMYFEQNYNLQHAVVQGTLIGLYAAQYNPGAAIASSLYRDGQEFGSVETPATLSIVFSSDLGTTNYDVYFTDTGATGIGIDSNSIVKSTSGFTVDVLGTGDPLDFGSFTYLAIIRK